MSDGGAHHNIALVGPSSAGKSTLLESFLFLSGVSQRKGRVSEGNAIASWTAESKARGLSTDLATASFSHGGHSFTVLDCPGTVDFVHDCRSALLGVDLAIVVIEPLLERVAALAPLFHYLDAHALPHMVLVNKMDRSDIRFRDLLDALRAVSARPIVPHHYAIGRGESLVGYIDLVSEESHHFNAGAPSDVIPLPEDYRERERDARTEMLETLADFDDDLMEVLLEEQRPSEQQVIADLRKTIGADLVVPVYIAVAEHDMGVRRLMDVLVAAAPDPSVRAEALAIEPDGQACVQILKNFHLQHTGKVSLARIWRGEVKDGTQLGGMRVGGVLRMMGGHLEPLGAAGAGRIVALGRLENAHTGEVLVAGEEIAPPLPVATPPQPMAAVALQASRREDEVKLSAAFAKLVDEDPSLVIEQDPEMHQTLLWGQGDIHLKVALDRLRSRYNLAVDATHPQTAYRETIRSSSDAHGRHKKQSGGHGQFADVKITIEPRPRGEGFGFRSEIVGGAVPKQYIPAVEAGARDYLAHGPLGYPAVDVGIVLKDGQFHSVDSNELSFKMAVALALKDGMPHCDPVLLEQILSVTVSVPAEHTSKVLQLATQKRGQILGYEAKAGWPAWDEVRLFLPQSELYDLLASLRSLSQGTGFFQWAPDHLQEVPDRVAGDITAKRQQAAA